MSKTFISIYILLSLLACKTKSQDAKDINTSLMMFKEGSGLMSQGFKLEIVDSPTYRKYYKMAIDRFLISSQLDTSNLELGTYLSYLYYKTQKFDSAVIWGLKLLPLDSINNAEKSPTAFAISLTHLGLCYLNIGDLDMGKKYLKRALGVDKKGIAILVQQLLDLSDKVYAKVYPSQIQQLSQLRITPCKYSLDILNLVLELNEENGRIEDPISMQEKIMIREKNCS